MTERLLVCIFPYTNILLILYIIIIIILSTVNPFYEETNGKCMIFTFNRMRIRYYQLKLELIRDSFITEIIK